MKIIKPQRVCVLQRPFEVRGQARLGVALPLFFDMDGPSRLLPEVELWKFLAEQLRPETVFDLAIPKARAEYLVAGQAFAPGGQACTACHVRVKLDDLEKILFVVGNRHWQKDGPSDPEPFVSMPLGWEQAYGGARYTDNPLGKGHDVVDRDGARIRELPNVEKPGRLITSPSDNPGPASLLPIDAVRPRRQRLCGTYDAHWLETQFPGFADDLDWAYFNAAPEDQQRERWFRGDEPFEFENLHSDRASLRGRLPGFRARAFVRRAKTDALLEEVPMQLDTVWFFPHAMRGVLVFHGMVALEEDDAADIALCVAAAEALAQPKTVEHYRSVVEQRQDPERGRFVALRDSDLLPPKPTAPSPPAPPESSGQATLADRIRDNAQVEIQRSRDMVRSLGLDPDEHGPLPIPPQSHPPTLEQLPDVIAKADADAARLREQMALRQETIEATIKKHCEDAGISWDKIRNEFTDPPGGPPAFSAAREVERMQMLAETCRALGADASELEGYLRDPAFTERLETTEREGMSSYRQSAHSSPKAPRLDFMSAMAVRERVLAAYAAGESLAGWDLTGAALDHLSLCGADLSRALLENAVLCGADLSGCNLREAVLAHADLTRATLSGACLDEANMGSAQLVGSTWFGESGAAHAEGAELANADATDADLRNVRFGQVQWLEANLTRARLDGADLCAAAFIQADLRGASFAGASLTRALFVECKLDNVNFGTARLDRAVFVDSHGEGVCFRDAELERSVFAMAPRLEKADFCRAHLNRANLREARLSEADFSEATMDAADLSEATMDGTRLFRTLARDARFVRTDLAKATLVSANLMGADLQKADLRGTDLRLSNLFRANLGRAWLSGDTMIDGARTSQVQLLPRRRNG